METKNKKQLKKINLKTKKFNAVEFMREQQHVTD